MDDFLEPPVERAEDAMAINGRQKNDREPAAFEWCNIDIRKQGTERILDPFHRQQPPVFHEADILDCAVAWAEDFRRADGNRTVLRLQATREDRV